jgi:hypothetical protein
MKKGIISFKDFGNKIEKMIKLKLPNGAENIRITEDHSGVGKIVFQYTLNYKSCSGTFNFNIEDKGQFGTDISKLDK